MTERGLVRTKYNQETAMTVEMNSSQIALYYSIQISYVSNHMQRRMVRIRPSCGE
jgi:hypothetical protein